MDIIDYLSVESLFRVACLAAVALRRGEKTNEGGKERHVGLGKRERAGTLLVF